MLSAVYPAAQQMPAKRPRLLFVSTRYLFPTDSGGKIRTASILRGMRGGAFELLLTSPLPDSDRAVDTTALQEVCDQFIGWRANARGAAFHWTRMRHLTSRLPVAVATDDSPLGRKILAEQLRQKPDLLVIDFPHAAVLAPPPYPCPSVLFTHNVEAEIFRRHAEAARDPVHRAVWRNQARKMARFEGDLLGQFSAVVAVADRDRDHFRSAYGATNVFVIPTGVDFDHFTFAPPPPVEEPDGGTLVFTGSMDWLANSDGIEHFMDHVWPLVARARPRVKFVVVGRSPSPRLIERARSRRLAWTFTGFVDDVRPYVRQAHAYVIPLRVGGGTRIKVYEAMAMGCPVVSTRIGVEGLPLEDGRHFVAADRPADMAAAILSLLADNERRQRISCDARRLVEENMSAANAARVFEQICQQALQPRSMQ